MFQCFNTFRLVNNLDTYLYGSRTFIFCLVEKEVVLKDTSQRLQIQPFSRPDFEDIDYGKRVYRADLFSEKVQGSLNCTIMLATLSRRTVSFY